jgi:hypothetical protein
MASGSDIRIEVDRKTLEDAIKQIDSRVKRVTASNFTKRDIARIYAKLVDPYVPYDTGQLATYGILHDGKIVYSALDGKNGNFYNYAWIQYTHDEFNHNKEHHELATDHWDEVATPIIWDEFVRQCNEVVKRRFHANLFGKEIIL